MALVMRAYRQRCLENFFYPSPFTAEISRTSLLASAKCYHIIGPVSRRNYWMRAYTLAGPLNGELDNHKPRTDVPLWSSLSALVKLIVRDIRMLKLYATMHRKFFQYRSGNENVASLLQKNALRHPNKVAIISEESQMTFKQLEDYSNKVADVFSKSGLQKNDTVALFGTSSPEYVGLWLGLSKLQIRSALLNSNLLAEPLMHGITAVNAKALLVDTELLSQFNTVRKNFPENMIYYYNENPKAEKPADISADKWLNSRLDKASTKPIPKANTDLSDILIYIYTSGTTGLPKASIITQRRFMTFTSVIGLSGGIRKSDVIYCPLPLYHTSAGITTIGQAIINGSTVVIKKKFSATQFWDDVVKYQCTVFTYIGEICRFLLAQPPSELEHKHRLRMAYGPGLRPALWDEFINRFKIADVREMYGATEGNAGTANVHGKPGAMGYLSPVLSRLVPSPVIIPIDQETGNLILTENGMCREARPGEEGELMGPITTDPLRRFEGYTDTKAASSKIVENVLRKGDKYFRTGDIVTRDEEGFVFFVDRFGDSFRWKGENVSTTEIEGTISKLWQYADVVVYGVPVPGCDGKAGMLCVAARDDSVDLSKLYEKLLTQLPSYAVPVFIRFSEVLDVTGTFKLPKVRLKKEGFSPEKANGDKIYYLDSKTKTYKLLTKEIYQQVTDGQIRF